MFPQLVCLLSLCLMWSLNLTMWQKISPHVHPVPWVKILHCTVPSRFFVLTFYLSQKINNTKFSHFHLAGSPLGIFTCLWDNTTDWEPGKIRWRECFQSTLSLLLEWTGWHSAEHEDERGEEVEEKVLVEAEGSLGLCFWCRAIAARMLMMCTWKYIDLGKKGGKSECNFYNFIINILWGEMLISRKMWLSYRAGHKISC